MVRSKKRKIFHSDQSKVMSSRPSHVVITTGSHQGIGSEIVSKAISSLKPSSKVRYTILTHEKAEPLRLARPWLRKRIAKSSLADWLQHQAHEIGLVVFRSSAADMVKAASRFCLNDSDSAMANAPMRKLKSGAGHTEIIKDLTGSQEITMGFIGKKFNVCLATTHVPLVEVPKLLSAKRIEVIAKASQKLHSLTGDPADTIGVLGLNPHAGENGAISSFDGLVYSHLKKAKLASPISRMLPADGAFVNGAPYRTILAWYHDQGLIPFKLIHGLAHGIQLTLGIPFIRTSVDHGTAEDIVGTGKADFRSMRMAIQWASQLQARHGNSLFY
jgi:4-hydroxythreonine-4-phosphate dehydrogenase